MALFGPVERKPGLFLRPVGFVLYRLNYQWAGIHATRWHVGSISLHAIDAWLVYLLCRNLGLRRSGSLCAGLIFAMSAAAAEPVAWIDAGFDLVTTAFVLVVLLLVCRYLGSGNHAPLAAALAVTVMGVLSKESAYCLPALVVLTALIHPRADRPRALRAFLLIAAACIIVFAYRWWALGGVGGYLVRGAGAAEFLRYNLVPRANALLLRLWTVLFSPVNWSEPLTPISKAVLAALPLPIVSLVLVARIPRRQFLACLGFTLAAAIPAQEMLLIGLDLSGTRVLYLPAVGMALLWGLLSDSVGRRAQVVLLGLSLAIQVTALEHNLVPWHDVPESARAACRSFGLQLASLSDPVTVGRLPATERGVVFLQNGLPECVEFNSGVSADRIRALGGTDRDQAATFVWDDERGFIHGRPPH